MATFRVHKEDNYTVLDNGMFKDKELSLKSLGLLCKMLSLPPEWDFNLPGLVTISKESTAAVRSALQELQELGYVKITKKYPHESKSGRIEYTYDIYEVKQQTKQEKQDTENHNVVFPTQLNTQQANHKSSKEDSLKENKKYIVEETSTSHTPTESSKKESTSLEDFRKNYITSEKATQISLVTEVIDHLNKVTGKNYKATTPETKKMITARLSEGYTVAQMKKVIDHRWEMWKGTDMEQYMRPNTLFRPSKFENYVNAIGTKRKMGSRGCSDTLALSGTKADNNSIETKTLAGRKF